MENVKKLKLKKFFLFTFLFLFFLLNAGAVFALEAQYPTILGFSVNETSTLPEYARYFFNLGIYLAGGIAAMALAFGGVYYLISYFSGKFTSEGKDWMKAGLTGLLLVLGAWLIAYAINPDLVKFRLDELPPNYFNPTPGANVPDNAKVITFNAVPVGISTEKLLTNTTDCYDFDAQGDPISVAKNPGEFFAPGNYGHDRIDCILKLVDGAQKKYQMISKFSAEIIALMEKCKCTSDVPDETGKPGVVGTCKKPDCKCGDPQVAEDGTKTCADLCFGASCQPKSESASCCPADIKKQIEEGIIKVKIELPPSASYPQNCTGAEKEYHGLKEFRSELVLGDGTSFVKNLAEPGNGGLINIQNWNNLKLIEQFAYFREKIEEISQTIKDDQDALSEDKKTINSAQCYLSTAYADLVKRVNATDPKNEAIKLTAQKNYSKYCKGFNYGTSSCYKSCQDACPSTSVPAVACYQKCNKTCEPGDIACANKKTACVADCINSAPCNLDAGPANFGECITSCRSSCVNDCSKKYLMCSDQFQICQDMCKNDSKCILSTNANQCLIGTDPQNFVDCSIKQSDSGNGKFCIGNSFLCQYGSYEYAGYPDCLDPAKSAVQCPKDKIYSSDLWKNKQCQLCPSAFQTNPGEKNLCIYQHPETSKCPASSKCPNCPCDVIDTTFTYILPTTPCPENKPLATCRDGTKTCICGNHDKNAGGGGGGGGGTANPCPCGLSVYCPCNADSSNLCPMNSCVDPKTGETFEMCSDCPFEHINNFTGSSYDIPSPSERHKECSNDKTCIEVTGPGNNQCSTDFDCDTGPVSNIISLPISEYKITGAECMEQAFNDDPLTFYCQADWWKDPNREGQSQTPIGENKFCTKDGVIPVGQTIDNSLTWSTDFLKVLDKLKLDLQDKIKKVYNVGDQKDYCKCDSKMANGLPACSSSCNLTTQTLGTNPDGTPYTQDICAVGGCSGLACQSMIDMLSELADTYRDMKTKYTEFFKNYLEKGLSDRGEALKQLTYSRQKTNSCGISTINSEKDARMFSCQRVQDELMSAVLGDKITMDEKTIKSYCYGKEFGKLLTKDLTDDWFCCEQYGAGSSGGDF